MWPRGAKVIYYTMQYMFFQYDSEPVLIQRILISFKAELENILLITIQGLKCMSIFFRVLMYLTLPLLHKFMFSKLYRVSKKSAL